MRRNDREITDFAAICAVIEKCEVCHLALFDEKFPYVVPLNFGYKAENGKITLYFHGAAEGRKHELIKKNPHAAFVMEKTNGILPGKLENPCTCSILYESVMGEGSIQYIEGEEKDTALHLIMDQCGVLKGQDYTFNPKVMEHTKVYKMEVENLSAKQRKLG